MIPLWAAIVSWILIGCVCWAAIYVTERDAYEEGYKDGLKSENEFGQYGPLAAQAEYHKTERERWREKQAREEAARLEAIRIWRKQHEDMEQEIAEAERMRRMEEEQ